MLSSKVTEISRVKPDTIIQVNELGNSNHLILEENKVPENCNLGEQFIWESVSVHFDVWVFLRQCLVHSLVPFTIIFSPNPYAQYFAFRLDYEFSEICFVIYTVIVMNTITTATILIYILMGIYAPKDCERYLGSFIYPVLYSSLWRLSIAIRHASFSKSEYKKLMSITDFKMIVKLVNQSLVNRNYVNSTENDVSEFEIIAGGLRNGFNVYDFHFTIQNPKDSLQAFESFNDWKTFLCKYSTNKNDSDLMILQEDGSYIFSIAVLCKCINNYSQQAALLELSLLCRVLVSVFIFLLVLSPFYDIVITKRYEHLSSLTIVFLILSTRQVYFYFQTVVGRFLFGAILDMRRQAIIAECFSGMIRTNDHVDKILINWMPPWIRKNARHARHEKLAKNHSKVAVEIFQCNVSGSSDKTMGDIECQNIKLGSNLKFKYKDLKSKMHGPSTEFENVAEREYFAFNTSNDEEIDAIIIPRISLLFPENLFQWAQARLAMQTMKLRFRKRQLIFFCKISSTHFF